MRYYTIKLVIKMKEIIRRSYTCLIYIFFALFIILIRMDANESKTFFCVGLLLGALILSFIPFLINKCKKIQIRRWYLISWISLNLFVILQAIYLLVLHHVYIDEYQNYFVANNVWVWVLRVSQALFLATSIFTLIFTFKDYLKKEYTIQKFDLEAIQMIINLLAYIAIIYIVFDYSGYHIQESMNPIDYVQNKDYTLMFGDFSIVLNGLGIVSLVYIILYITIEIIKYYKFDKKEDTSKDIFN